MTDTKEKMSPLQYLVRAGACTMGELGQISRTDKATLEVLKRWAEEEMAALSA